jgi:UDPglucose 6-dehydrogenase
LCRGRAQVLEPSLEDMLVSNLERIQATTDTARAVSCADIIFIVVPTPSEPDGSYSLAALLGALKTVGQAMKVEPRYRLIVVVSTVLPGSCRCVLLPQLEKYFGHKCGPRFGFAYNPAFVALGDVIKTYLNPDFVLIGQADNNSGDVLEQFYRAAKINAPIRRMGLDSSELTKIALNSFLTMKISFVNSLASICEQLDGGDVDEVTNALSLDSRIGPGCTKGGLGYGGPCLPRDNTAFGAVAKLLGATLPLAQAADEVNQHIVSRISHLVLSNCDLGQPIGILGLAYKDGTDILSDSHAFSLMQQLSDSVSDVFVFDRSLRKYSGLTGLPRNVRVMSSADNCVAASSTILVTTQDPTFLRIPNSTFHGKTVFDCWRLLKHKLGPESRVRYRAIGCQFVDNDSLRSYFSESVREPKD